MLIGVVGAPNQGKSTFFNALTLAGAQVGNFPFTTIKPNQGVGHIRVECPETKYNVKCNPRQGYCVNGQRFIPVTLLDVAGLVPDAHLGKGLGNQFLADLASSSALIHVIDVSGQTNMMGEVVAQDYGNVREKMQFLEREMNFWMKGILDKSWHSFSRKVESEKSKLNAMIAKQFSGLGVNEKQVLEAIAKTGLDVVLPSRWTGDDLYRFCDAVRALSKPIMVAANKIDMDGAMENYRQLVKDFPGYKIMPVSSEVELALRNAAKGGSIEYLPGDPSFKIKNEAGLSEKQKKALKFLEDFMGKNTGTNVQQLLNYVVVELLRYVVVLPVESTLMDSKGNVLPDAFLMPPGSTALDLAYALHSDFGDNFICAIDTKTKMKLGRDYVLKNMDIIEIVSKN